MKARYVVLLMVGAMSITAIGMTVGYYLNQDDSDTAEQSNTSSSSSAGGLIAGNSNSSGQLIPLNPAGGQSAGAANEQPQQLPAPNDFDIYEQYSTETTAMYQDIVAGNGAEVAAGDTLAVLYQGWLTSGELFDQSRVDEQGNPEPFVFQLGAGQVIRGWEQGLGGMRIGGKRRLIIPAVAGYGQQGTEQIPPNSMLIFDVELVQAQQQHQPSGL